jgi:hypothetical protein
MAKPSKKLLALETIRDSWRDMVHDLLLDLRHRAMSDKLRPGYDAKLVYCQTQYSQARADYAEQRRKEYPNYGPKKKPASSKRFDCMENPEMISPAEILLKGEQP